MSWGKWMAYLGSWGWLHTRKCWVGRQQGNLDPSNCHPTRQHGMAGRWRRLQRTRDLPRRAAAWVSIWFPPVLLQRCWPPRTTSPVWPHLKPSKTWLRDQKETCHRWGWDQEEHILGREPQTHKHLLNTDTGMQPGKADESSALGVTI